MIELIRGDITKLDVDAIVNAANTSLLGGGGVDGAIHRGAGPDLREACRGIGGCKVGEAVRTPGFNLKARWVIHAVGPVWSGGARGEPETLERAYENAFARACEEKLISSIAFPSISTGAYRFPIDRAAKIALGVMRRHEVEFERIIACLFSEADLDVYRAAAEAAAG
jgi:O-acetyl-ADP-ribose deacetylase (regulator of RNase III)